MTSTQTMDRTTIPSLDNDNNNNNNVHSISNGAPSTMEEAPTKSLVSSSTDPITNIVAPPKLKLTFKLSEIRAASPISNSDINDNNTKDGTKSPSHSSSSPAIKNLKRPTSVDPSIDKVETESKTNKRTKASSKSRETSNVKIATSTASFVVPFKKTIGKGMATIIPSHGSNTNTTNTTTILTNHQQPSGLGRASSRVTFPELVEFVRSMRQFRTRPWSLNHATIPVLGSRNILVEAWTRDPSLSPPFIPFEEEETEVDIEKDTGKSSKKHEKSQHSTMISDTSNTDDRHFSHSTTLSSTFVCPLEGCHRIYDDQEKWKRHQVWHRKKLRRLERQRQSQVDSIKSFPTNVGSGQTSLQLKLNVGALKRAASPLIKDEEGETKSPLHAELASEDTPTDMGEFDRGVEEQIITVAESAEEQD